MKESSIVEALFIGKSKLVPYQNKQVETGIFKEAQQQPVIVHKLGIVGDEQGDKVHHGGEDKAICVYLNSSYQYWKKYKEYEIAPGAFGENIVLSNWREEDIYIGDQFQIADAIVEVSQPRQPCFKLGIRNNWKEMLVLARNSGYTGFYLRVIQEGTILPGASCSLIRRAESSISVRELNKLLYSNHQNKDQLQYALQIPSLAEAFKKSLRQKLDKLREA